MAPRRRKRTGKRGKSQKQFHVDLNAANWPHFKNGQELQSFLDAHVTGDAKANRGRAGWKAVTLHISLEPKKASPALSLTEVSYLVICPKPPC